MSTKWIVASLGVLAAVLITGTYFASIKTALAPTVQTTPAVSEEASTSPAVTTTPETPTSTPSVPVATPTPSNPTPVPSTPTPSTPAPTTHSMAEVATHNSATSCWTAINGKVYDVTSWINQHPGGRGAILGLCGTDGSSAFNGQHGGQARPAAELAAFAIGALQ